MQLHTPLGLLLISLAGLVLIFHALRPRYRQQQVPSLRLWQSVTEALSLQARWRRLIRSLLLLVHLLLVILLALAIAEPSLTLPGTSALHVHIMDTSASMLAEDVVPSRFAVAVDQAAETMRGQAGRWAIIQAGAGPRILYQGGSRSDAAASLLALTPETAGVDWEGVADLMVSLGEIPSSVILWTDGGSTLEELGPILQSIGEHLAVRIVGTDSPFNVGITAFDARRTGEDPLAYEALVTVRNFSQQTASGTVRIVADEVEIQAFDFTLPPDDEAAYTFPLRLEAMEALTATLDVTDHFALDDTAVLHVRSLETTRVALVGPLSRPLEQVLHIFPQVDFDVRLFIGSEDTYHLRIQDGLPPDTRPGTQLVFAPPLDTPWSEAPVIVWWDPVHPLTRYIDWGSVRVARAKALPVGSSTRVLIDSTAGPLLTVEEQASGTLIQVGFSLDESDLPQRVAFPIFMDNVLRLAHEAGWERVQPATLPPREEASLTRHIEPFIPETVAAGDEGPVTRSLWPLLIAVAIVLLFVEGWLFQYRSGNPFNLRRRRAEGGAGG